MTLLLILLPVFLVAIGIGVGFYLRTSTAKTPTLFGDLNQTSDIKPAPGAEQCVFVSNPIRAALVGGVCTNGLQCHQRLTAPGARAIDAEELDAAFFEQWRAALDAASAVTFVMGLKRLIEHYAAAELVGKDEFTELIKRSLVNSLAKQPCHLCLLFARWSAGNEGKLPVRWSTGITDVFVFDPRNGTVTFKATSGNEKRVEQFASAFGAATTLALK